MRRLGIAYLLAILNLGILVPACTQAVDIYTPPATSTPIPTQQPSPTATVAPTPVPTYTPTVQPVNSRIGWMAFDATAENRSGDLYLLSPDFQTTIKMGLSSIGGLIAPSWSPDWQRLVFQTSSATGPWDAYVVDVGCVDLPEGCLPHTRNLTEDDPGLFVSLSWSSDGQKIVYTYRYTTDPTEPFYIWVMNPDGTGRNRLSGIEGDDPRWSPDGQMIAFESWVIGEEWGVPEGEGGEVGDVFLMNADGSNPRRLTRALPDSEQPAWSPDGQKIAFLSAEGGSLFGGARMHIYIINVDGTGLKRLTGEFDAYCPAWSPDGKQIAFSYQWPDASGIYLINADGTGLRKLVEGENVGCPAWSP